MTWGSLPPTGLLSIEEVQRPSKVQRQRYRLPTAAVPPVPYRPYGEQHLQARHIGRRHIKMQVPRPSQYRRCQLG